MVSSADPLALLCIYVSRPRCCAFDTRLLRVLFLGVWGSTAVAAGVAVVCESVRGSLRLMKGAGVSLRSIIVNSIDIDGAKLSLSKGMGSSEI